MVTSTRFRELALAFDDVTEVPHMDRAAFRTKHRIYATMPADEKTANLKLAPEHQEILCSAKGSAFAPVSGGWGKMGWTTVTLSDVTVAALKDALSGAHTIAATKAARRPSTKR